MISGDASDAVGLHVVEAPDEETARALAEFMVGRGYTAVRVRHGPDRQPRRPWRVTGLDEGPFPDHDRHWWVKAEERIGRAVAGESGLTWTSSSTYADTARRFLLDGEVVADRTVEEVRHARLAALAGEPARAPVPEVVHRLGASERTGELGEPVVLEGLDDIDWGSLTGAYGPADGVPDLLRRMAANDEGWDEAHYSFFSEPVHQDTCYSCTPHTVGFLVQLARAPHLVSDYRLELLTDLFYLAMLDPGPACGEDDGHAGPATRTGRAVLEHLPEVLARWPDASPGERAHLSVLAALSPDAAAPLLPEFRVFREEVDGPSPMLDLALALASGDDDRAAALTLEAAGWDEAVSERLWSDEPLRARHLDVLFRLSGSELRSGQPLACRDISG